MNEPNTRIPCPDGVEGCSVMHFAEDNTLDELRKSISKILIKWSDKVNTGKIIEALVPVVEHFYRNKIPEKIEYKPIKNMSCSFSCQVLPAIKLNPCPDCGGTSIYEWEQFSKKYRIAPDQVKGYNQAISDVREALGLEDA